MTLKILFIGDPVAELKPGRETTLALIFEAQRRDMNVDYCTAKDLCLTNGKVIGRVQSITLNDNLNDHIHTAAARMQNLAAYDIIVLRSNPAGYARIDTSYVLDILADKVLIVNDPRGIREMHGKYFISQLPDFIVPYAFVEHPEHLKVFMDEHKDVIIKPVNGFGGYGIRRVKEKPADINTLFDEIYTEYGNSPFIVQPFIADAVKGD